MATNNNIDGELQQILTGYYGSDIRMAIYEALKKLWDLAKSKEGGGPGPGPSPLPTDEYWFTVLMEMYMSGITDSDIYYGEIGDYPQLRYIPLTSETAPDDWDEHYFDRYYAKTGTATFSLIPETTGGVEYQPNTYYYYDRNYRGNPYKYTLIETGQTAATTHNRQFYNACIGDVYIMMCTTGSYFGPCFITKDELTSAYQPGSASFIPYPYLIDGEQWRASTAAYWFGGSSDPGTDWRWMPYLYPSPGISGFPAISKTDCRTVLEYIGAIKPYILLTSGQAPDDWFTNHSNYYRYDDDSSSSTYQDYISLGENVPYTADTYYKREA